MNLLMTGSRTASTIRTGIAATMMAGNAGKKIYHFPGINKQEAMKMPAAVPAKQ